MSIESELKQFLRVVVVTGVVERNTKYLMLKRGEHHKTNKNRWQPAEGRLEFGENVEDALKREIKEETGMDVDKFKLQTVSSTIANLGIYGKVNVIRIMFKCSATGEIILSDEHSEFAWVDSNEIDALELVEGLNIEDFKKCM